MKTKCVYVLVSTPQDYYLEQLLISVSSLKFYNPNAFVIIAIDRDTFNGLVQRRSELKKYVSEFVVLDCPSCYDNIMKSRYIKTNLRKFVHGDFLFIDSDTVVADSLETIDDCDCNIGAVYDSNINLMIGNTNSIADNYINVHTKLMGWTELVGFPHFNSGVMLVRECEVSHRLYELWHQLWMECINNGVTVDQIALCRANKELNEVIKELPGVWNCQIQRQGLPLISQAKIIHCFTCGNVSMYSLCTKKVLKKIKNNGFLDCETINMIKNAKTAFEKSTQLITQDEAELLQFPIVKLYYDNLLLFRMLNKIATIWYWFVKP